MAEHAAERREPRLDQLAVDLPDPLQGRELRRRGPEQFQVEEDIFSVEPCTS